MAALSEQMAGERSPGNGEDRAYADLLTHTNELSGAMQRFLIHPQTDHSILSTTAAAQHLEQVNLQKWTPAPNDFGACPSDSALARKLLAAATRCRERRQELSLLVMEPNAFDVHSDPFAERANRNARQALAAACGGLDEDRVTLFGLSARRSAAIISNCDRRTALSVAQAAIRELGRIEAQNRIHSDVLSTTLSLGVATACVVARNFDSMQMIESALRCLNAARGCGISSVKSIEV
jgi:hypothetical protein